MGVFRLRNPLFLILEILTPVQGRGASQNHLSFSFLVEFEANPCDGVNCSLVVSPCFTGIWAVLGSWSHVHHLSFSTLKMTFLTLKKKTDALEGRCPTLT